MNSRHLLSFTLLTLLFAVAPTASQAYRDPETGTFITRDPAGFIDGPNMYTYVRQNPWTKFDPLGLYEEVYRQKPDEDGVVKVKVVIPIAYRNGTGNDGEETNISPEQTAKFNKILQETFTRKFEHGGVTYDVTAEVRQVTNNSYPVEIDGEDSDEFLTDEQHATKYRYNLVTFDPGEGDGGHWEGQNQDLRNNGTVGPDGNVENTLAHEVGHALDLEHNYSPGNLMDNRAGKDGWRLSPQQRSHIINKDNWETSKSSIPGKPAPTGAKPIINNTDPAIWKQLRSRSFQEIKKRGRTPVKRTRNYINKHE